MIISSHLAISLRRNLMKYLRFSVKMKDAMNLYSIRKLTSLTRTNISNISIHALRDWLRVSTAKIRILRERKKTNINRLAHFVSLSARFAGKPITRKTKMSSYRLIVARLQCSKDLRSFSREYYSRNLSSV